MLMNMTSVREVIHHSTLSTNPLETLLASGAENQQKIHSLQFVEIQHNIFCLPEENMLVKRYISFHI